MGNLQSFIEKNKFVTESDPFFSMHIFGTMKNGKILNLTFECYIRGNIPKTWHPGILVSWYTGIPVFRYPSR